MLTKQQLARKNKFEQYYQKQSSKIQELKMKREEEKILSKDPKELQIHVQKQFKQQYDNIIVPINEKLIKTEEQISKVIEDFQLLFQYYCDINYALIAYDKQQYKEQLEQLECTIYNLQYSIVPRQKFKFSKPFPKKQEIQQEECQKLMESLNNDQIIINPENYRESIQIEEGSLVLKELKDTTFRVEGSLDTLYLHSLVGMTVDMGDVRGSVWVDKCFNCHFKGKMHQLRIHDTESTEFVIFVQSNPIIERSKELRFGKVNENANNYYNQVQDFNWLKQEKSPNFIYI